MKINYFKDTSKLIRSNDIYDVYDYRKLDHLVLSLTELHIGKNTTGHSHDADEVYVFISGNGKIEVGKKTDYCEGGEVFIIPRNSFHKVYNTGKGKLKFWCIFERYGKRG